MMLIWALRNRECTHKKVVEVRAEKHRIAGKYGVFTAREIDEKYKKGELEEEGTWEDFFKLDHLEYEEKEILELISKIFPQDISMRGLNGM